jgi:magnesium chelatase family protein
MDRIDMHIEVMPVPYEKLRQSSSSEPSGDIRDRILDARERQRTRFVDNSNIHCNAQMGPRELRKYCRLDQSSSALMKAAVKRLGLSARAFHRLLKVARTISDLAGGDSLTTEAVAEAIQYRSLDRGWKY